MSRGKYAVFVEDDGTSHSKCHAAVIRASTMTSRRSRDTEVRHNETALRS